MATAEGDHQFSVSCPCCGSELRIDAETRMVLYHQPASRPAPVTDLAAEVDRLRNAAQEREQSFQRSLAAERQREQGREQRFDDLLRRARESPAGKPVKDIDLD